MDKSSQTDKVPLIIYLKGYRMVSFNLKVLAKFGLCSNCSQKLDGCSLARALKIFATACQHSAGMFVDARKDHSIPLFD